MPSKILLALAAAAAAQTTTVQVFAPMIEGDLVATVLAVDGAATTLGISCPEGADSNDCGLPGSDLFTYISSPSTISHHYDSEYNQLFIDGKCDILNDKDVSCTTTVSVGDVASEGIEQFPGYKTIMNTITVTAGAEKLTAAADAPTGTSGDKPKETGAKEGDDENGAPGLAGSSLLAAAVAVGAVLV